MKKVKFLTLAAMSLICGLTAFAQRGYNDAPYTRYEAEAGSVSGGTTTTSYAQNNVAYEASGHTCVYLANGKSVEWTANGTFRGIVARGSGCSSATATGGSNVTADLYIDNNYVTTLTFDMSYGWKNLQSDGNSNYNGVSNSNPRMRFQEARYLLSSSKSSGTKIKIVSKGNLYLDFIEIEDVDGPISCPSGYKTYSGNGSNLQDWLDSNGGNVYIPEGTYTINKNINPGDRIIQGAGMWYTTLNFNNSGQGNSGFTSYSTNTEIKDLYMNQTVSKSRSNNHKGINGVWKNIEKVWVEHFECGAWFGNYNGSYGSPNCKDMKVTHCRFRNNYADGVNLCQGSVNCTVSHCSFRNNGDDDMAVWPASDQGRGTCHDNTFEYNTAENCWFASSAACYGGYGNKWKNLVIKDNYEVGIRVNGTFPGYGFGDSFNEFSNITIEGCGSWYGPYGDVIASIDLSSGNQFDVKNIKLSCIDIKDSKSDAFQFRQNGYSFNNIKFAGITVNGANKKGYTQNSGWGSACGLRFVEGATLNNCTRGTFTCSNVEGENIAAYNSKWNSMSEDNFATCATVKVTGVSVSPTSATIGIGEVKSLAATVSPADASNKAVSWSSNKTNIATVDANGNVTGVAEGNATITVTTQDGNKTATCAITVQKIGVTGIEFESSTATVAINGTATVKANVKPDNATNKGVTYAITSGSDKASVNATTGVVTGKAAGTAVVTATSADGNKTATCTITVVACTPVEGTNLEVVEVTTNPTNPKVGDHVYFTATIRNNAKNTVTQGFGVVFGVDGQTTWSQGNQKFLWCDQYKGNSKEASANKVNITACSTLDFTSNGGAGDNAYWTATEGNHSVTIVIDDDNWLQGATKPNYTYNFTVSNTPQPSVTSVTVSPATATATVGETINLTATVEVENGAAKTVTWSSSNDNITVSNSGAVTATAAGTATITATSTVDGNKKGTATVTFNAANVAVTGVSLSANPTSIYVGSTSTLTATISPNNATNKNVTYTIQSGPGTIQNNVVTATGAGTIVAKVTTADGNKTATVNITASNVAVTGVTINASSTTVLVNETVTLSAEISPSNATNKDVTFSVVSGSGSINGNILTATGTGDIKVRATTTDGGKTSEMTITATDCNATGAADLVITDVDWAPRYVSQNDEVKFIITVKNQGGTALPVTTKIGVLIQMDGSEEYHENSNTYIWSDTYKNQNLPHTLEPCGTIILETNSGDTGKGTWKAGANGNHTVKATVDDSGLVAEKDENNNVFTKTLVVNGGQPTGWEDDMEESVEIIAVGKQVFIKGLQGGEQIDAFSILGVSEKTFKAVQSEEEFELPTGVHIIRINNAATRILIP